MNQQYLPIFYLELSKLLGAGIPIDRALETLRHHFSKSFQKILNHINTQVQSGETLSEALSTYPRHFSLMHCTMIKMAEHSGKLSQILALLAEWTTTNYDLRQRCKNALFYPALSLSGALLTLCLLINIMLPNMVSLYEQFHQPLPASTLLMMNTKHWLSAHWITLLLLFLFFFGAIFAAQYYSSRFKKLLHYCVYYCPLWHAIQMMRLAHEFSAQLAILTEQNIPITQALKLIQHSQSNQVTQEKIERVYNLLSSGSRLSETLSIAGCFQNVLINCIKTGEQIGQLSEMLHFTELYYATQLKQKAERYIQWIEPCSLVLISIVVAWIAYSFYQPLLSIQMF